MHGDQDRCSSNLSARPNHFWSENHNYDFFFELMPMRTTIPILARFLRMQHGLLLVRSLSCLSPDPHPVLLNCPATQRSVNARPDPTEDVKMLARRCMEERRYHAPSPGTACPQSVREWLAGGRTTGQLTRAAALGGVAAAALVTGRHHLTQRTHARPGRGRRSCLVGRSRMPLFLTLSRALTLLPNHTIN